MSGTEGGRVLVTGASGFVGRWLSAWLAGRGTPVRGLVRPGAAPLAEGVERAEAAGLDDRAAVARALEGVDSVVHLAARVHVMRETAADPAAEFRRVNVEGTHALLEESAAAGVRAFAFASSVKAMGERSGDRPWTEADEPEPVDPYGVSKLEAERLVADYADRLHTTSLRLPLVYGPGMKGNMISLFRLVDRGLPLPLGGVRNRRSLAYVGNVAAAFEAALRAPAARGKVFFVSDGEDLSTPGLVRAIAAALGRPARLLPVPEWAFRAGGRVGDLAGPLGFPLTTAAVGRLLGSLAVDISALRRACAFTPPFTVAQGLAETARWYRGAAAPASPDAR